MPQIRIVSRYDSHHVLYEHEAPEERVASGLALRDALEAACRDGASLFGARLDVASLDGASLVGANLDGASLAGASLVGASLAGASLAGARLVGERLAGERPILQIGPIGSRSDYLLAFLTNAGVMVRAGCFYGMRDEFAVRVAKEHGDNVHGREYVAALAMIDAHAALWMPAPAVEPQSAQPAEVA